MFLQKLSHKVHHNIFTSLFLIAVVFAVIWTQRWIFFEKIDPDYLGNYYQTSQWVIPQSKRVMSDNELYQLAGYRLFEGASPFEIAPEVPPGGKYLYGLSIFLSQNPYWTALGCYLLTLLVFYWWLKNKHSAKKALMGTGILALTPIFARQVSRTMMDLPQLFLFMTHIFLIEKLLKFDKKRFAIGLNLLAGISLGLMASTKFPLFIPVILIIDLFYFFQHKKPWSSYLLFITTTVLTFIATFAVFFFDGNGIFDWLRAEKWVLNFYLSANDNKAWLMFPITMLTSFFKGWWDEGWTRFELWSTIWPISMLAIFYNALETVKQNFKKITWPSYSNSLLLALSLIYAIIPFWPRYFLLILPLVITYLLTKIKSNKWLYLLLIITVIDFGLLTKQNQFTDFSFFKQDWEKGLYTEMYDRFTPQSLDGLNREEFAHFLIQSSNQKQINSRQIEIINHQSSLDFEIREITPIGELQFTCQLPIVQIHGKKYLSWSWDCVYPQYQPKDEFVLEIEPADAGKLWTDDNFLVSAPAPQPYILLEKNKVPNKDEQLFHQLYALTGVSTVEIENLIVVNTPEQEIVELGGVVPAYDQELLSEISTSSGIIIESRPSREYNQLINTKYWPILHQIIEPPHTGELLGRSGGQLKLVQVNGQEQVILSTETVDGRDVYLPLNREQLELQLNQLLQE